MKKLLPLLCGSQIQYTIYLMILSHSQNALPRKWLELNQPAELRSDCPHNIRVQAHKDISLPLVMPCPVLVINANKQWLLGKCRPRYKKQASQKSPHQERSSFSHCPPITCEPALSYLA